MLNLNYYINTYIEILCNLSGLFLLFILITNNIKKTVYTRKVGYRHLEVSHLINSGWLYPTFQIFQPFFTKLRLKHVPNREILVFHRRLGY